MNTILITTLVTLLIINQAIPDISKQSPIQYNTKAIKIQNQLNTTKTIITENKNTPKQIIKQIIINQKKPVKIIQNIISNKTLHKILNKKNYYISNTSNAFKITIKNKELNNCKFGYKIINKPNEIIIFAQSNISAINAIINFNETKKYSTKKHCEFKDIINYDLIKNNKNLSIQKPKKINFNHSYEMLFYESKISPKLNKILNLTTIVTISGLWSNLTTSLNIPKNISQLGFNVFKIQLTGGKNQECKNCYNYNFTELYNITLKNFLKKINNITNNKITIIGHSNGCRTPLYFLENNPKQKLITNMIGMGCPGEFIGFNPVIELIKKKEKKMFETFKKNNITHTSFNDIKNEILNIPFINTGPSKISTNLFKDYIAAMKTNKQNIGTNIKLKNILLIYGEVILKNDFIVFSQDSIDIYNNINSTKKEIIKTKQNHLNLPNTKETINSITKKIIAWSFQ